MKFFTTIFLLLLFSTPIKAKPTSAEDFYELQYKTLDKTSYKEPVFITNVTKDIYRDRYLIVVYADPDNFPISSQKQGSVFYKVFSDLFYNEHVGFILDFGGNNYAQRVNEYEKILRESEKAKIGIAGIFAVPYEYVQYSRNKFLYPSIFENDIHLITPKDKKIDVELKEDLKKYKGVYAKQDKLGNQAEADFKRLNITAKQTFDEAFETLLTGQADFMVGSYYRCQIELYKRGLRKYVNYSKNPIWKIALFFKLAPVLINNIRIKEFTKYLKTKEYKKRRDDALNEVLEYYKENTKGVIPPTYTNSIKIEQTVEN